MQGFPRPSPAAGQDSASPWPLRAMAAVLALLVVAALVLGPPRLAAAFEAGAQRQLDRAVAAVEVLDHSRRTVHLTLSTGERVTGQVQREHAYCSNLRHLAQNPGMSVTLPDGHSWSGQDVRSVTVGALEVPRGSAEDARIDAAMLAVRWDRCTPHVQLLHTH